MKKKNIDYAVTILNILLVSGILLLLGAINAIISYGISGRSLIIGVIAVVLISISIIIRMIYNTKKNSSDNE